MKIKLSATSDGNDLEKNNWHFLREETLESEIVNTCCRQKSYRFLTGYDYKVKSVLMVMFLSFCKFVDTVKLFKSFFSTTRFSL